MSEIYLTWLVNGEPTSQILEMALTVHDTKFEENWLRISDHLDKQFHFKMLHIPDLTKLVFTFWAPESIVFATTRKYIPKRFTIRTVLTRAWFGSQGLGVGKTTWKHNKFEVYQVPTKENSAYMHLHESIHCAGRKLACLYQRIQEEHCDGSMKNCPAHKTLKSW